MFRYVFNSFFNFFGVLNISLQLWVGVLDIRPDPKSGQHSASLSHRLFSFFFYTLERNLTCPRKEKAIFPEKVEWLIQNRSTNNLLLSVSFFSIVVLLPILSKNGVLIYLFFGALALTYSIVKPPKILVKRPMGLKENWVLKPVVLCSVWIYLTFYLPIAEGRGVETHDLLLLTGIWFCWIFANSVLFDLRDRQIDLSMTIAKKLGKKRSHKAIIMICFTQFCLIFLYVEPTHAYNLGFILSSAGLSLLFCNHYYSKRASVPPAFYMIADLTLVLPGLLIALVV